MQESVKWAAKKTSVFWSTFLTYLSIGQKKEEEHPFIKFAELAEHADYYWYQIFRTHTLKFCLRNPATVSAAKGLCFNKTNEGIFFFIVEECYR
jgi:hypothetical protein